MWKWWKYGVILYQVADQTNYYEIPSSNDPSNEIQDSLYRGSLLKFRSVVKDRSSSEAGCWRGGAGFVGEQLHLKFRERIVIHCAPVTLPVAHAATNLRYP